VQALESDRDATGVDIAAFNALLMRVKTTRYNSAALERDVGEATARLDELDAGRVAGASPYLRRWYAPRALAELLAFRSIIGDYEHRDVLRVGARAGRALRATYDALRPRLSSRSAARPVLVPQAQAGVHAGDQCSALRPPLRARHRRADRALLERPCREPERVGPARRTPAHSTSEAGTTGS
jgi:hypothetical protein